MCLEITADRTVQGEKIYALKVTDHLSITSNYRKYFYKVTDHLSITSNYRKYFYTNTSTQISVQ